MKHAALLVLFAGFASAAWFRPDRVSMTSAQKISVPDPGPQDEQPISEILSDLAPEWDSLENGINSVWVPDEPYPVDLIAERPSHIQTVSDEQPFAVTDGFDAEELISSNDEEQAPMSSVSTEWKSAEGRPIVIRRLGSGKFRTVILTGMDGRDRPAVQWSDELAEALMQHTDLLNQQEFILIRAVNPDGLAMKQQKNARGVILNRNFPTRHYQPNPSGDAGAGPASEPEIRAVLQTLYDTRPQRIIHLSSTTGKPGAFFNPKGEEIGLKLDRLYHIPTEPLRLDLVPGSVEEFADATWNVQVLRLNIPLVLEEDVANKVLPVVISAVALRESLTTTKETVSPVSTPRSEPTRWQVEPTSTPVPPAADSGSSRRNRNVKHRGYEELPPPPQ